VVAVPAEDVADAERQTDAAGCSCEAVAARECALAQLAACLGRGDAPTAIVSVASDAVALAVAREGRMAYARVLAAAPGGDEAALARMATEVEQTLDHCAYARHLGEVAALFVVGEPALAAALAGSLREASLPVRDVGAWPGLNVAAEAGAASDVLGSHAACVGALAAEHERRCGRQSAGPLLRGGKPKEREQAAASLARLIALNVLLLVALIASAFAVRSARLRAVNEATERAKPLLAGLTPLEEEVRVLQSERELLTPKLDLLLAVARALPKRVEVSELRIDRKGHVAIHGTTPSVEAVSQAVAALGASEEFADPSIDRVEPTKRGMTFHIDCTVR
jgi:hypothetical protein